MTTPFTVPKNKRSMTGSRSVKLKAKGGIDFFPRMPQIPLGIVCQGTQKHFGRRRLDLLGHRHGEIHGNPH